MKSFWSSARRRSRAAADLLERHGLSRTAGVMLFACSVPLLLRLSLPRLQGLLGPVRTGRNADEGYPGRVRECLERLFDVAHPFVRRGCLCRGLTLYYFLRRSGVDVHLCFGMGLPGGELDGQGHCWLERDGQPYLEKVDPEPLFVRTFRMGAA